jgi:hypothetical protein
MTAPSSPPSVVHIVVPCTNRKRFSIPPHLRLGSLREQRQGLRFAAWTRRLAAEVPAIPARDLYGGEHWHVARNPSDVRRWWRRLADWPGPKTGEPRSFTELARRDPNASIVAVMSEPYLRACAADLREAATCMSDVDRLAVIGPSRPGADVEDLLVPITARLRPVVGGSLHALYARAAAHLLSAAAGRGCVSRRALREKAQRAIDSAPADSSRRAPGVRLSDNAVQEFIRHGLDDGQPSATVLLRQLRDAGLSCEQSRFKRLYQHIIGQGVLV